MRFGKKVDNFKSVLLCNSELAASFLITKACVYRHDERAFAVSVVSRAQQPQCPLEASAAPATGSGSLLSRRSAPTDAPFAPTHENDAPYADRQPPPVVNVSNSAATRHSRGGYIKHVANYYFVYLYQC